MKGDDLSTFLFNDHSNWENKFGAPGYFLHRVDLHNGLKDLTCHRLSTGKPAAKMRLATAVSMIDPEAGQITLADGEIVTKDLIIVADGVHSSFVSTVTGGETAALQTGTSGFRFLIPTEKLLEDEEARPLFEGEPSSIRAAVLGETRIVWYPCRKYVPRPVSYVRRREGFQATVRLNVLWPSTFPSKVYTPLDFNYDLIFS